MTFEVHMAIMETIFIVWFIAIVIYHNRRDQ